MEMENDMPWTKYSILLAYNGYYSFACYMRLTYGSYRKHQLYPLLDITREFFVDRKLGVSSKRSYSRI
ncbi:hypothetical protein NQ317_006357 [Molorchus minor]|uniref:Uncharacterized protein n=1 Tax=Molorchus minor TaxID=1323400 RepID=A0ABQ9JLQ2_9CUCU|nr:hypothetical protein NQ317_006357 [Molorchus minor]